MSISVEAVLATKSAEAFFGSPDRVRSAFLAAAKALHPDHCGHPLAASAFAHLKQLYDEALEKVSGGTWGYAGEVELAGLPIKLRYLREARFELGHAYIADSEVAYVLEPTRRSMATKFCQVLTAFRYGSERMEREVKRFLPHAATFPCEHVARVPKKPELLRLRDVLDHFGGSLEPRHVAWILSTLYNLACYLSYSRLTHNDLSPDTYFINPADHSGALLGGWWYCTAHGETVRFVPERTNRFLPFKVRATKKASRATDAELILATGRELLGDITGHKLHPDTPKPMRDWLTGIAASDAVQNYRRWGQVLDESFGPRRFVEMKVNAAMLYQG